MESIWKVHGMIWKFHGIHQPFHGIHQPVHGIHLESPWNPSASTLHSMDSIWNNMGRVKYCMDGAAGGLWVEVLGARRIVCGWCALTSLFLGGGDGAPSSVFVHHGTWPSSLSWWSCRRLRVRVVGGHSCLRALHPSLSSSSSSIISVCCHCVLSSLHVLAVIVCPLCIVVLCPPHCCPMLLLLLCPHCDMSFGCTMWHLF